MLNDTLEHDQFEMRESILPELEPGQALVRVLLVNIHSRTRLRMARGLTKLGETDRTNYACAVVVKSRDLAFKEGDVITCQAGWQDYQVITSFETAIGYPPASELVKALNGTNSQWTYVFRPAMVKMWSPAILMEMFGTSGMTAYFGLRECGPLMPRDKIAVAGTTGSVGTIAAQLAKIAGCYVIGFAGSPARRQWVIDALGIDGCIDYREKNLDALLGDAFPGGIDFYCDGVGGHLTKAILGRMNCNGRMLSYGAAAALYADKFENSEPNASFRRMLGISEEIEVILRERNIKSEAWIVDAFYHERLKAEDDLSRLMLMGRLKPISNIVEGFEHLPSAIVDLYRDGRAGKLQVKFGDL
jgi:NADPH-dependent curcumin reductase CurA